MLKKRIIISLTFLDGVLFRTKKFNPDYRYTKNFVDLWSIDELILIDISKKKFSNNYLNIINFFSTNCFVPICIGGGIKSLKDADLYFKKDRFINKFKDIFFINKSLTRNADINYGGYIDPNSPENLKNYYWAQRIKNDGELILWFRHAHREKWDEGVLFLDNHFLSTYSDPKLQQSIPYKNGICLSKPRGLEQAKVMGQVIKKNNIKFSKIISSPSCRSFETALYVFERIDEYNICAFHPTGMNPKEVEECAKKFREKLINTKILTKSNIIIVGHGNTLDGYGKNLIHKSDITDLTLFEGGFFVIEKVNKKLILRHSFKDFSSFAINLKRLTDNFDN